MSKRQLRVTVWNENVHERTDTGVRERYPDGIHGAIAEGIRTHLGDRCVVRTAVLDEPDNGLTPAVLAQTDVLTWWGHVAHERVSDHVVEQVHERVLGGMGLVVLHSGHFSKIFRRLMGTSCSLRWRSSDDRELVWVVKPAHPVAEGVPNPIQISGQEMYGEAFDIPDPDELVFISSFTGGEVFRSGCAFFRGNGKIFYFSPGDQEFPVYHHPHVRRVIANAVAWVASVKRENELPRLRHSPSGWLETSREEST